MMEPFVRNFIRASVVWLGVGVLIGVSMAFWPAEVLVYRPAHVHANLLGFVSMMIFGVAYHVIPRFAGRPLAGRRLPRLHWWLANAGLTLLVGGWLVRVAAPGVGEALVRAGAVLSAAGAFCFIHTIWRTLGGEAEGAVTLTSVARSAAGRGTGGRRDGRDGEVVRWGGG